MNKMNLTLAELSSQLVTTEGIMKKRSTALMTEKSNARPKLKGEGRKGKKKSIPKGPKAENGPNGGVAKAKGLGTKGKCFHRSKKGHWKRNCPDFLSKKKTSSMIESLVSEVSFATGTSESWCVDFGATNHICNSLQGFRETRRLSNGEIIVNLGSEAKVDAVSVRVITLCFSDNKLILSDTLYVPSLRRNLISVSSLVNKSYSITFGTEVVIKRNGTFICSGKVINGLYLLTPTMYEIHDTKINNRPSLKRKSPSSNPTKLWHLRLGHINLNRIDRLVKDGILPSLVVEPMPVCESCLEGKMTKRPFSSKGNRAKDLLELVHTDVCGPINVRAKGGYEYFITFTDDYSRYGYIYLLHRKSEAFKKFKEFRAEAEKQLGKSIKTLRSDRGEEYLSADFMGYLLENGIISQLSAPGMPQQNGVAERRNRTLLDIIRSMMSFSGLPISF